MDIQSNRIIRAFWLGLGLLLSLTGLIGIIVPGLPTTPIMILAAACFFRSSERLYNWVLDNKFFGKHVRNYRDGRGMPIRAKKMAIPLIWIFVSISVFYSMPVGMVIVKGTTILCAAIGTGYILSLPTIQ